MTQAGHVRSRENSGTVSSARRFDQAAQGHEG
jgi:hypothetical protein